MKNAARIAILSAACLTGCATDNQWTFALSRQVYDSDASFDAFDCHDSSEGAAVAAVAILALPLVIDLVLLPVTATRDAIVFGAGG